jgi:hypothetical protein
VTQIRKAEESIEHYRSDYDAIVVVYNKFILENKDHMREIDHTSKVEKKPQFQMVSE